MWFSFGYTDTIISPYNYCFKGHKFPNKINLIYNRLKELVKLYYFRFRTNNKGEGSITELNIQRKKGSLKALVFSFSSIKQTANTINLLQNKIGSSFLVKLI